MTPDFSIADPLEPNKSLDICSVHDIQKTIRFLVLQQFLRKLDLETLLK